MRRRGSVTWWLSLEVIAVATPLIMVLTVGTGKSETIWSDLLVITGSQAAATLVVAVLFASRLKLITNSVGIGSTIRTHRLLGSAAVLFILLHLIAVVAEEPDNAWLVTVFQAPARAIAGTSALAILLLMLAMAEGEKAQYEAWRWTHRVGGYLSVGFIVWHIVGLNQLINDPPWAVFFLALFLIIAALPLSRWTRATKNKKYVVIEALPESPTVTTVTLQPIKKGKGIRFAAGQFVWIRLSWDVWSEDHPFTVASAEQDSNLQLTYRQLGDWTKGYLSALRPGEVVWIDGPHGAMNLARIPSNSGIALIAVGVGLTPVMSVLRTLSQSNRNHPVRVFISPRETLFIEELENLEGELENLAVFLTVQQPIVPHMFTKHISNLSEWFFIVCGPPAMVVDCQAALTKLDVPERQILTEQFEII